MLTESVIYTAPGGKRHAAIVSVDPIDESAERDLTVFWLNGEAAFPMRAVAYSAIGTPGTWDFADTTAPWPEHSR